MTHAVTPSSARSRHNTFASLELNRRSELRDDTDWLLQQRSGANARFVLLREDGQAMVSSDRRSLRELGPAERTVLASAVDAATYLGHADGNEHFLVR